MTLICTTTGRKTTITQQDIDNDGEGVRSAANRLISRSHPGYFVAGVSEDKLTRVEILRAVGDMCEHSGEFVDFTIRS